MNQQLTILTPTFNRGYILPKLYESLVKQSDQSFTWFIIDDGSSDKTNEIVKNWISQKKIDIIYLKVANGGKPRAINIAIAEVDSEYLMIVDSDDQLTSDAIETTFRWIEATKDINTLAGFAGLKGNLTGDRLKNKWMNPQKEYIDAYNTERNSLNLLEDKAEVFKMSILKNYSFKVHPKEKHIPLSYVLDAIAKDGYKFRWYNKVIYLCDYIEDGLTQNGKKLAKNNTRSNAILHVAKTNFPSMPLFDRIKSLTMAIAFMTFHWDFSELKELRFKWLLPICLPMGLLAGIIRQIQWRNI